MHRLYDFFVRLGENRCEKQLEILQQRYPLMFEDTPDMMLNNQSAHRTRGTRSMPGLKLQTNHSAR